MSLLAKGILLGQGHHDVTMTSQIQIFAKLSDIICLSFFSASFKSFESSKLNFFTQGRLFWMLKNSNKLLLKTPSPRNRVKPFPRGFFACTRNMINTWIFWRVFLRLFKFLITFGTFLLHFLQSISGSKSSRFRVLHKAVLGGFLD